MNGKIRIRKTGDGGRRPKNKEGSGGAVLTLSVSMVAISSSAATSSPTFFCHVLSVPSEMDSAIWGTLTVSSEQVHHEVSHDTNPAFYARHSPNSAPFSSFVVWNWARRASSLERVLGQTTRLGCR